MANSSSRTLSMGKLIPSGCSQVYISPVEHHMPKIYLKYCAREFSQPIKLQCQHSDNCAAAAARARDARASTARAARER